jgi:hypothetical protein
MLKLRYQSQDIRSRQTKGIKKKMSTAPIQDQSITIEGSHTQNRDAMKVRRAHIQDGMAVKTSIMTEATQKNTTEIVVTQESTTEMVATQESTT